jgi:hypothetical protein
MQYVEKERNIRSRGVTNMSSSGLALLQNLTEDRQLLTEQREEGTEGGILVPCKWKECHATKKQL